MGTRTPKCVSDYPRFKADVGVRCRRCGRLAVFDAKDVMLFFYAKRWSTSLPLDARHFRCACRSRDVETIAVPIDARPNPLPPRRPYLTPIYVK